jgi:hypothetical protein
MLTSVDAAGKPNSSTQGGILSTNIRDPMILGQALAQHVDEAALDEAGNIVVDRLDGFALVAGQFRALGRRLLDRRAAARLSRWQSTRGRSG